VARIKLDSEHGEGTGRLVLPGGKRAILKTIARTVMWRLLQAPRCFDYA
jgi:hypothetical protein